MLKPVTARPAAAARHSAWLFMLVAWRAVQCAAAPDAPVGGSEAGVARSIPEIAAALDRPASAELPELLGTGMMMLAAGLPDTARSVNALAERHALLRLAGQPVPAGRPLREALHELDEPSPADATLRAAALAHVRVSLPEGLADAPVDAQDAGQRVAPPAEGGDWTRRLRLYNGALRLPVRVEYTAASGQLGGVIAILRLRAAPRGRDITITATDRGTSHRRWRQGQHYWIDALVSEPAQLGVDELRRALRAVAAQGGRLQASIESAWLTPADDEHAPLIVLGATPRGEPSFWDDAYRVIRVPSLDHTRAQAALASASPQSRCLAAAPLAPPQQPAAMDAGAGNTQRPVPLDSPILQGALGQPVPDYPAQLLPTVALLEAAGHPAESATLARQVERAQLLALLGQPPAPPATVGSLLSAPASTGTAALPALDAVRACVANTAIGLDFPDGATMGGSYQPAGRNTWRSATGELYVPVRIANQAAAALTTATFSVRLVPLQGGAPVALFVDRSGGAPIDGHQSAQTHAYLDVRTGGVDAATLDRVIDATRRGEYRLELADWRLRFEAGEQLTLTPRGLDWDDPTLRVTSARLALKAAPCADVAGCGAARSGKGLSSPYGWIFGECLLALVGGVLLARRHESRRLALAGFFLYGCLACGAAGLAIFDPPTGSGMSGILSVGSSFMLGLPWSLSLANPASKGALLGHLFTAPDADLMAGWVGMAINQLILGLLAFWRVGGSTRFLR